MTVKSFLKKTYIYKIYANQKRNRIFEDKARMLRMYGNETIKILYEIIYEKYKKPIWMDYGTLLGAIREQDFIPYDFDMDFGMLAGDFTDEMIIELENKGFRMLRALWKEDLEKKERVMTEMTFCYKGVLLDIFFSFIEDGKRHIYSYLEHNEEETKKQRYAVLTEIYNYEGFEPLKFKGIDVISPKNPLKYLALLYGDNFMTPIKNYEINTTTDPCKHIEDYNVIRGISLGGWE